MFLEYVEVLVQGKRSECRCCRAFLLGLVALTVQKMLPFIIYQAQQTRPKGIDLITGHH